MTIRQAWSAAQRRAVHLRQIFRPSLARARPPNDADGIREKLKMLLEQSVGCEWEVGREGRTLQQAEQSRAVFDELEGREGLAGRGREGGRRRGKSLPSFGKAAAFDALGYATVRLGGNSVG